MKTLRQIKDKIKDLESDERLTSPVATIFENAPLALIQLELESKIGALKRVLELKRE